MPPHLTALEARRLVHIASTLSGAVTDELEPELERCARAVADLIDADALTISTLTGSTLTGSTLTGSTLTGAGERPGAPLDAQILIPRAHWYAHVGWLTPPLEIEWHRAGWLREWLGDIHMPELVLATARDIPERADYERAVFAARGTTSLAAAPLRHASGDVIGAIIAEQFEDRIGPDPAEAPGLAAIAGTVMASLAAPVVSAFDRLEYLHALEARHRVAADTADRRVRLWRQFMVELGEPMTVIASSAELLHAESERPATARHLLSNATRAGDLLLAGMELLAIESGEATIAISQFDVVAVLRAQLARAAPRAAALGVALSGSLADEPVLVRADRDKLARLISWMMASALAAVPRRRRLSVGLRARDDSYAIELEGLAAQGSQSAVLYALERLQREPADLIDLVGALGIGLGMAAYMARIHDGHLWFEMRGGWGCLGVTLSRWVNGLASFAATGEDSAPASTA